MNPPVNFDIITTRQSAMVDTYDKEGAVPCNFTVGVVSGEVSLRPYDYSTEMENRCTDARIKTTKGSFTLTVGNLSPGNYIFEVTHYIGGYIVYNWNDDPSKPQMLVEVTNGKSIMVKTGTNGIIESILEPTIVTYPGYGSWNSYRGKELKVVVRYSFHVSVGDNTKTFTWGTGAEISLDEMYDNIHIYEQDSNGNKQYGSGGVIDTTMCIDARVYTAQ